MTDTPILGDTEFAPLPLGDSPALGLDALLDVPVKVRAVLGRTVMDVGRLSRLRQGEIVELDRRIGELVDVYVNDRLVARGELVLVDDQLGVSMTEIVKSPRA